MTGYVDVYRAPTVDVEPAPEPAWYFALTALDGTALGPESQPDTVKERALDQAGKVARWLGMELRKNW